MYALLIKRSAERDLRRLPRALFERVNERILALRDDPRPHGVRVLVGALEGWGIRVGDHRIFSQFEKLAKRYLDFLSFVSALIWLR